MPFFRFVFASLVIFSASFFWHVSSVSAATLGISPSKGSYGVGKTFSVSIIVSSSDQAMNAAQGVLSYPPALLQATSISKAGSVMNLWVEEPSYANGNGTLHFEGVVLNPGYRGSGGKILTVTFRVQAAGEAAIRFSSASVLANDGEGTSILTGTGQGAYTLGDASKDGIPEKKPSPQPAPKKEETAVPAPPSISSSTHPDQEAWYANRNPRFAWKNEPGTTGVRMLLDQSADTDPGTTAFAVTDTYGSEDLVDGTWYFHLRVKNARGWSAPVHYRANIDTANPTALRVEVLEQTITTATLGIEAIDEPSGIRMYEIRIDGGGAEFWLDDGSHRYTTPPLKKGTHAISIAAVDKAGNRTARDLDVIIQGLEPPKFTSYPLELHNDELLRLAGKSYGNALVDVFFAYGSESPRTVSATTSDRGVFIATVSPPHRDGAYSIWAVVRDGQGKASDPSARIYLQVIPATFAGRLFAAPITALLLFLVLALFLCLLALLLGRKKHAVPERAPYEILADSLREAITLLKTSAGYRPLTREEERLLAQFERDLSAAESSLEKHNRKFL